MALTEQVRLDLSAALRDVDRLGNELRKTASQFFTDLSKALSAIESIKVQQVDARKVTTAVSGAVEAADTQITPTADAAPITGAVTAAVDNADTQVEVTGTAQQVTGAVSGAVDAADTNVTVTGDATPVTGAVTAAVDNADTNVTVTGEAAPVTGAINAAVEAANTRVSVTADSAGLQQAVGATGELQQGLGGATAAAAGLSTGIGGLGTLAKVAVGAAATGAIFAFGKAAVDAASDLSESSSKARVVFGDNFGQISKFAENSATAVGLSSQAALEATGTFGNLFTAIGLSRGQAADVSTEVVQLGADLASFNNIPVDVALEKLRSGLVGEVEPLRTMGINFNEASVQAKAVELGLAKVGQELTDGQKVQARYALITEQSSNAQGDFARTSDGLANSQRIAQAELENTRAEIGQALLPVVLKLVQTFRDALPTITPILVSVAESIAELVQSGLPLVETLLPLLTTAAGGAAGGLSLLFGGLGPIISLLGELPAEAIAGVGAFFALSKALTAAKGAAVAMGLATSTALGPIGIAVTVVGAVASAFGLFGGSAEKAEKPARDIAKELFKVTEAAEGSSSAIADVTGNLTKFISTGEDFDFQKVFGSAEAQGQLEKFGLTLTDVSELLRQGEGGATKFASTVSTGLKKAGVDGLALQLTTENLNKQFGEAQQTAVNAANAQIQLAVSTEEVTRKEVKRIESQNKLKDGTVDYITVAAQVAKLESDRAKATDDSAKSAADAAGAIKQQETALSGFVAAAAAGTITSENFADAAKALGADADTSKAVFEAITKEIQGFVDTATGQIPKVSDVFSDLGDELDPKKLTDRLREQTKALAEFGTNLKNTATFFPEIAKAAAEAGPQTAGKFLEAVKTMPVEAAKELEEQLRLFREQGGNLADTITASGPGILTATGDIGRAATEALGQTLTLSQVADAQLSAVQALITGNTPALAAALRLSGGEATGAFGGALKLQGVTDEQLAAATKTFETSTGLKAAAAASSNEGLKAFTQSLKLAGATDAQIKEAIKVLNEAGPAAKQAGQVPGGQMSAGLAAGFDETPLITKIQLAMKKAAAAVAAAILPGSPSKVYAEFGKSMAQGLAVGVEDFTPQAVAAVTDAVSEMNGATAGQSLTLPVSTAVTPTIGTTASSTTGDGFSIGALTLQVNVTAAPGMTSAETQAIGDQVGLAAAGTFQRELRAQIRAVVR